ncbi:MAG: hypothetical protein ROY99_15375 [Ignavibacterium sp.]|jgi:hypothetical protein|nr:hypothetical protein [Ignavibacterium sp.]
MSILDFFKKKNSVSLNSKMFGGGDGSTEQNAVIINASSSLVGIPAEYEFIQSKFGAKGRDWELEQQMQYDKNSRSYDIMEIKLSNGISKKIFFDITNFYGKF